jgi:hypothetical protein
MKLAHLVVFEVPAIVAVVFLFCLFGIVFVVNPSHYTIQIEEKNSNMIAPGTSKTTRCANFINLQDVTDDVQCWSKHVAKR